MMNTFTPQQNLSLIHIFPDLFAREGEEGFRVREHQLLCQLSRQSGQIIACGGGIVTRQENWDPMLQNSTVIYLRRDLALLPTSGRPVSCLLYTSRCV